MSVLGPQSEIISLSCDDAGGDRVGDQERIGWVSYERCPGA